MERIIKAMESEFPLKLAYDWDNVGLLIGNSKKRVKKVLIALDVNENSVEQAIKVGADAIISHHPAIFAPLKRITDETAPIILKLLQNDICVYSAHTNADNAADGVNARLAEMFGLSDTLAVDACAEYEGCGLGRVGRLASPVTIGELCALVKEKLNTPFVRVICPREEKIECIAVLGGSCSEFIPQAVRLGAQAVITGDMKYHNSLDLAGEGITVIDAGHFPTERHIVERFREVVDSIGGIETIVCDENDVYIYM